MVPLYSAYTVDAEIRSKTLGNLTKVPDMSTLLDEHAAAFRLGISPQTLAGWRCAGTGPVHYKIGTRLVRYAVTDLDAFVNPGRTSRDPVQ